MTNNNENRRTIRKWNTTGRRESQKPQTVASEIRPRSYSPDSERDYGSEESQADGISDEPAQQKL